MRTLFQNLVAMVLPAALAAVQGCGGLFGGCVLHGTPVATPSGPVAVEALREGDAVWTVRADGPLEAGRVVAVRAASASSHIRLSFDDGRSLDVTGEHPVGVADGFVPAGRLRRGDSLRTASGERAVIAVERINRPSRVYDISVEPNNTYLAAGVVVHNKSVAPQATREGLNGVWVNLDNGRLTRLVIHPDGTGLLTSNQRPVAGVYRVRSLEYDRGRKRPLFLRLTPLDPRNPERILSGRAYGIRGSRHAASSLMFDQTGPLTLNSRAMSFVPEESVLDQLREAEAAAADAAAGSGPTGR